MYFTKSRLKEDTTFGYTADNSIHEDRNRTGFYIFLSHSYKDKEYIRKLKKELENYGYSVYVDWIVDDARLDRSNVTKRTAELIRTRMKQSNCLIYATSENSPNSKWMPWELGCFDGLNNSKIAILPITDGAYDLFKGQEYLELYPIISENLIENTNEYALWVNETPEKYINMKFWIRNNEQPYFH